MLSGITYVIKWLSHIILVLLSRCQSLLHCHSCFKPWASLFSLLQAPAHSTLCIWMNSVVPRKVQMAS